MAEMYFDNKLKEASVNRQRQQKTIEAFHRLPEEFTIEDIMRCFNLDRDTSARSTVHRLIADNLAEKVSKYVDNGKTKALFCKKNKMIY